jgi:hypothetical protein
MRFTAYITNIKRRPAEGLVMALTWVSASVTGGRL